MSERAQGNRPCFTKKVVLNGVEYREVKPKKAMLRALELTQHCLRAVDGSKKVIVGPEDLVGDLGLTDKYYYVSTLGDYYRAGYEQRLMVAGLKSAVVKTLIIRTDEPGFMERAFLTTKNPVKTLKKMRFKIKYLVEKEKGKKITILDQIKWFRIHPTVKMIPDFEKVRKERMLKIQRAYPRDVDDDDLVLIGETERVALD
mgnify:CR=1 FL=1